jgi:hypothetical protein
MLAFDLQFSRLNDVIHFSLRPQTLPQSNGPMEEKSALGIQIFWAAPFPLLSGTSALRNRRDLDRLTATESRTLPRHVRCLQVAVLSAQPTIYCAQLLECERH